MKHSHCHCGFKSQIKKLRAGKLGALGIFLVVGHLLFHVAECLIIPAIILAINRHDAEAIEELSSQDIQETTFVTDFDELRDLKANFFDTLEYTRPLRR